MLRMSNDWKTLLWFYLSLSWLVVLILIFWIKAPEGSKTFQTALVSPSPINQGSLVIQLEKAEISRVSDSGKEWEIHTDDLSKDGENIYLNGVQGFLYQGINHSIRFKRKGDKWILKILMHDLRISTSLRLMEVVPSLVSP